MSSQRESHFQTKAEIIIIYTAVIPCLPGVYTVCTARVGMALVPLQTVTSVISRGRCLAGRGSGERTMYKVGLGLSAALSG